MISMGAGFAAMGKRVFVSTFAVFAVGLGYNQIRQSVAYSDLDVKIVATHAGISVGGDGATHQMLEDLGMMRAMPNMRAVIAPADSTEMDLAIRAIADIYGPCYVRCGREDAFELPIEERSFKIGKGYVAWDGDDVTILATGTMVFPSMLAARDLKKEGVSARVLAMPTVKPLDRDLVLKAARDTGALVTAEEHNINNGLGSAVCEVVAESHPTPVERVGTRDTFGESGEAVALFKKYGLAPEHIVEAAKRVLKRAG